MNDDYSNDPTKRNLQLEARAHIEVQRWVDQGGVSGRSVTTESICELHRRFCELLPPELLIVTESGTNRTLSVIPGELRREDVRVGKHVPVSPGALVRFLRRFENVYGSVGRLETILAAAAAHHRLLWIHPFLDGNGRVARWMSHAVLLDALNAGGIWSVARGLAR
jgi:Fic family protein